MMVRRYSFLTGQLVLTEITCVDAWPIGKRLHHIVTQLRVDEWKATKPGTSADALVIKESKLSKLDTLLRILKNTTDIDTHYPKRNMVAW